MNTTQLLEALKKQVPFFAEVKWDARGTTQIVWMQNDEMYSSVTLHANDIIEIAIAKKFFTGAIDMSTVEITKYATSEVAYADFFNFIPK